ncbi:coat F domain-containing protein [Desulfosporosinus orientis DSM 765]|uniref:Coat F domain-containing protein n=1 Tax=Desulfosporosinus orientis (strain ATCC 19365 / DSM 765 / NCIMB 8382 / VKM B-1628 / Singapore I) TaxID=768706 RepID=G7W5Q4_DESOD|nr:spore coat protein [Desulfosporosinus orientis]AET66992.1 coat F domain-containing protein [Desulfosporosinus orientis DSM 765]
MQTTLTEQEILTDLLTSEKHNTSTINTFITESTCANLRQNLKNILQEEHSIHENLYNVMNQKGWYPTSDAQAQEVQKAKDKYNSLQL